MLHIDILSAYVICGAGGLVGAAMLRLVRSPRPEVASALRLCSAAFLTLGISLVGLLVQAPAPGLVGQVLMSSGTLVTIVLAAWGLGAMAGARQPGGAILATVGLALVLPLLGVPYGTRGVALVMTAGMAAGSLLALCLTRRFLLAPTSPSASVLGLAMLAMTISSAMRLAWTMSYEGEPQPHLMHVPAIVQPFFAIFYGVLPILVSTMLLNLLNDRLREQLDLRANTDELTGALTRRALREAWQASVAQARRSRFEVAAVILDMDHFKHINDTHGHATGDQVLRDTALLLRQHLRPDSLLARYGGEEFVALVPVEDLRGARLVGERLRTAIENGTWSRGESESLTVTVSVGVTLVANAESLDDALRRADEALYRAKHEGRNQVQIGLHAA